MSRLFDGVDDQTLGTITAIADSDWTMACWVYPLSAGEGSNGRLMSTYISGDTAAQVFRMGGVTLPLRAVQLHATTNATSVSVETLATSAWSLAIATYRASDNTMRIFIGTLSAAVVECTYSTQTAGVGTFTTGGVDIRLGCRSTTDETFDGRIGPSVFDNREWTIPEMERFRSGLFPAPRSTVKAFYPLMSPTAAQAEDLSASGAHLTVTGATVAENPPVAFRWGDNLVAAIGPTAGGGGQAIPAKMVSYRKRRAA